LIDPVSFWAYGEAAYDGGNMWQRKPIHLTTDGEKEKEKER
jgi:hypothetical protein